MSGTYALTMGDRGRIVAPAAVRERRGLSTVVVEPVTAADAEEAAGGSRLTCGPRIAVGYLAADAPDP